MWWTKLFQNVAAKVVPPEFPVVGSNRHMRRAQAAMFAKHRGVKKTKRGATHKANPPGTKMARKAMQHKLAKNNPGGLVSEYLRDLRAAAWAEAHPELELDVLSMRD